MKGVFVLLLSACWAGAQEVVLPPLCSNVSTDALCACVPANKASVDTFEQKSYNGDKCACYCGRVCAKYSLIHLCIYATLMLCNQYFCLIPKDLSDIAKWQGVIIMSILKAGLRKYQTILLSSWQPRDTSDKILQTIIAMNQTYSRVV